MYICVYVYNAYTHMHTHGSTYIPHVTSHIPMCVYPTCASGVGPELDGVSCNMGLSSPHTLALLRRHVWHAWVTAFSLFVKPFEPNHCGPVAPEARAPVLGPLTGAGWMAR